MLLLGSPVVGQTALAGALWGVFASSCLGRCSEPPGGGLGGQALQAAQGGLSEGNIIDDTLILVL